MKVCAFGASAHQALSAGEAISDHGSQSMGDFGAEPKIPQAQFLEPSNHRTSAGSFPECRSCWESGGKARMGVTGSWKNCGTRPRWASSTPGSWTSRQKSCHCRGEERRRTRTGRSLEGPGFPQRKTRTPTLLCISRHTPAALKE